MSLTPLLPFRLTRALHSDGERRAYLVDERGLVEDYSALYVTRSLRNSERSLSAHDAALNAINVLYAFCEGRSIDLLSRFRSGQYLSRNECQALADFSIRNFGSESKRLQKVVALGKVRNGYLYAVPAVVRDTTYKRLTHIASFVDWLAKYQLTGTSREHVIQIEEMRDEILRLRPKSGGARDNFETNHFTPQDNDVLNNIIEPGAPSNPFTEGVQLRNLLIIEILRQCGVRIGEALNLRVRDIDTVKREITIKRRHDDIADPRPDQPLVKTDGRDIPISPFLTELIVKYVSQRRAVPGAKKHQYLLITYKSGPTQGMPMTKGAVDSMLQTIINSCEQLCHMTAHKFRHFFFSELASVQHQQGDDKNEQETHRRSRNFIAGRKPHSEVDALYTEQDTKRRAREAMLKVQEKMSKTKRSESNS